MDLTVYIPTRGRISLEHITLNEMKRYSTLKPIVVCPPSEANHYKNYASSEVLECPVNGIGPTRQFILENAKTQGVVMLDDDMYFSYRPQPAEPRPLERIVTLDPMFQWISDQLDTGYVHGGISARQGNQNVLYPWTDCIRVNNSHFFDAEAYRKTGLKFDALPVMEDFYISLKLMQMGYPNRVAYHFCWSQRGSGAKGGCSLYRTAEVQALAAEALSDFFPDYVKVVEKESDSQKGMMVKRKDVNISWLKMWEQEGARANFDLKVRGVHVADELQLRRK